MILKALLLKKFEFDKGSSVSAKQLNELKTRMLSKFVVVDIFFTNYYNLQSVYFELLCTALVLYAG